MPRIQFQLDLRCQKHPDYTGDCTACCFVRHFDVEFDKLRQRRATLVRLLLDKMISGGHSIDVVTIHSETQCTVDSVPVPTDARPRRVDRLGRRFLGRC
jgi:hypothetical protein